MIYLGSPYSHPDQLVMRTRFLLAEQVTAKLIVNHGLAIFSPIVHCHEMAVKYEFPTDFSFWKKYCLSILRRADELFVLRISGWDKSVGLTAEIKAAMDICLPIRYINEHGELFDGPND